MVEDEELLATALADTMRLEGFAVDVVATLRGARAEAAWHEYDAIVLDRRLPDGDGLELCRELRAAGASAPILMLTALDATAEIVSGLEAGADDYLTKPFATPELVARVRSLIRRGPVLRRALIEAGELTIDPARRRVHQRGAVVPLTAKEFSLLEFLAVRGDCVVDRYEILEHCWDQAYEPESNVIDVHVAAIRRKLGADTIETVRGAGYRLRAGPAP
jgi:two-component system, OmpR family, response regulator